MADQNVFTMLPFSAERAASITVTLQNSSNLAVKSIDVVSDIQPMRSDDSAKEQVYALSSVLSEKWNRCVNFGRTEAIYKRQSGRIKFLSIQSPSQNVTTSDDRLFTEYLKGIREQDLQPFSIYKIVPVAES